MAAGGVMSRLEFFYDYVSPYTYLAATQLPAVQAFLYQIQGTPVFSMSHPRGWSVFGERDEEQQPPPLNIDYLKGLNFLLNEQTDQALEHFLEMVRVDDKTIETHFALGSLFRRRGEVDRAIRIHQNIIARPDLAAEQRDQALFSLAKDYLHAGLLDRAVLIDGEREVD